VDSWTTGGCMGFVCGLVAACTAGPKARGGSQAAQAADSMGRWPGPNGLWPQGDSMCATATTPRTHVLTPPPHNHTPSSLQAMVDAVHDFGGAWAQDAIKAYGKAVGSKDVLTHVELVRAAPCGVLVTLPMTDAGGAPLPVLMPAACRLSPPASLPSGQQVSARPAQLRPLRAAGGRGGLPPLLPRADGPRGRQPCSVFCVGAGRRQARCHGRAKHPEHAALPGVYRVCKCKCK
jgi:hypothetical protein